MAVALFVAVAVVAVVPRVVAPIVVAIGKNVQA